MKKMILLFLIVSLSAGATFACNGTSHADDDETTLLFETILDEMSAAYLPDMTPVALDDTNTGSAGSENDFARLLEMLLETILPETSIIFESGKI